VLFDPSNIRTRDEGWNHVDLRPAICERFTVHNTVHNPSSQQLTTLLTHAQLAPVLGISREMIYRHEKNGKLTQEPGGGFDAEKAKAQFAANVKKKQGGTPRRAEAAEANRLGPRSAGGITRRNSQREPVSDDPNRPSLAKAQLEHERSADEASERHSGGEVR
jgi:hypothetical protein